jgi:hypothetical protein
MFPASFPKPADATLDVAVRPGPVDWSTIVADVSIASAGLCRGLFEVFLGSSSGVLARAAVCFRI